MTRRRPRVVWTPPVATVGLPPGRSAERLALDAASLLARPARPAASNALREAVRRAGLPSDPSASTPKEEALSLLQLAAEVEHALLVQYLYAAQSVRGTPGRVIARVAVQEMGHLVTVQNLLLALTGKDAHEDLPALLHLARDGLRRHSERNPLPFVLEPVSHAALAKFVVVERPRDLADPTLRARVEALTVEATQAGAAPQPVHALYAALRWLFLPDDAAGLADGLTPDLGFRHGAMWHVTDLDFAPRAEVDRFAATALEWGSVPAFLALVAHDRAEALAALEAVSVQGEGLSGQDGECHFRDFLRVLDDFEDGMTVAPLPRSPRVGGGSVTPEDPLSTEITHPYTALWARLFDLRYELVLVDLAWALSQPTTEPSRRAMVGVAVDTMNLVIQPLSRFLANPNGCRAGPPYGLDDEELPATRAGFRTRYQRLLARQAALFAAIEAAPDAAADGGLHDRLAALRAVDDARAPVLP